MIDKIIQVSEIVMWTILTLFIVFIAYIGLSYVASYLDFKPNQVGPSFMIEKDIDSTLVLENNDFINMVIDEENSTDTNVLVTLLPNKKCNELVNVVINEVKEIKNDNDKDNKEENETTTNEIKTEVVDTNNYTLKITNIAINKLVANYIEINNKSNENESEK